MAEKDGVVKVFDSINDTTPTVFADLKTEVYSYVDRGLLSLTVDPQWPARPYVYVLYAYDHVLDDPSPAPKYNDTCAGTGSGVDNGNCVASARLSRLTATPGDLDHMAPGGREGARRGLVPAVPDPHQRHRRVRFRRQAVRVARQRGLGALHRLRPDRHPDEPVR